MFWGPVTICFGPGVVNDKQLHWGLAEPICTLQHCTTFLRVCPAMVTYRKVVDYKGSEPVELTTLIQNGEELRSLLRKQQPRLLVSNSNGASLCSVGSFRILHQQILPLSLCIFSNLHHDFFSMSLDRLNRSMLPTQLLTHLELNLQSSPRHGKIGSHTGARAWRSTRHYSANGSLHVFIS